MLMNLKKLRENKIQEQMLAKIGCFNVMSEDIINYVCKDKIKYIPLKYNYNLHFYKYNDLLINDPVYTDEEYIKACKKPAIFHYTLEKPWNIDVVYRQKDWLYYKRKSAYKNVKLNIKKNISSLEKIFSVKNIYVNSKIYKQITILGIKIRIRNRKKEGF